MKLIGFLYWCCIYILKLSYTFLIVSFGERTLQIIALDIIFPLLENEMILVKTFSR